jgi:hypothetical protein
MHPIFGDLLRGMHSDIAYTDMCIFKGHTHILGNVESMVIGHRMTHDLAPDQLQI